LTAAQSAYDTLAASPLAQNSQFASALSQIGQDLQSGNTTDAQDALGALQQQVRGGHHHHHHGGGVKAPDQTDSTSQSQPTSNSQSSANDPDGNGDPGTSGAGATSATDPTHTVNLTV